jgi:ATP-binding protein involved in chromosome partitioning
MTGPRRDSVLIHEARSRLGAIGVVIMVGSGKGGVGKSLVASALAMILAEQGYKTGMLDLDLHGASLQNYFGRGPALRSSKSGLEPKWQNGVKAMSIGYFTHNNPVPVKGENKERLIIDLFALTNWGRLDYLIVDLPPGTGDEVMTAFSLFRDKSSLLLITTPSTYSTRIVARLQRLAQKEGVKTAGVLLNMSYLRTGSAISYPFGKRSHSSVERDIGVRVVGELPVEPKVSEENLWGVLSGQSDFGSAMRKLCIRLVS